VFPAFYGSYFVQCAPNLWDAIARMSLEIDGVSLDQHLKQKGIKGLGEKESDYSTGRIKTQPGTFLDHVRLVENDFWNERFQVYKKWKDTWYEKYLRRGYFHTLTGFRIDSVLNKKEVSNYPIQGSAFHCLLRALTIANRKIKRLGMDAKII
jgi:hypothetical protein